MTEASSIVLCNYSSLNMAIEMGWSESNKKFKAEGMSKQDLDQLNETCGHFLTKDNLNDTQRRLKIISLFIDLMVFDVANAHGGVDELDFEECLAEFMLSTFHVEGDDESIEQIAKIMMKVRRELCMSAHNSN